jgi:hypothetical protein
MNKRLGAMQSIESAIDMTDVKFITLQEIPIRQDIETGQYLPNIYSATERKNWRIIYPMTTERPRAAIATKSEGACIETGCGDVAAMELSDREVVISMYLSTRDGEERDRALAAAKGIADRYRVVFLGSDTNCYDESWGSVRSSKNRHSVQWRWGEVVRGWLNEINLEASVNDSYTFGNSRGQESSIDIAACTRGVDRQCTICKAPVLSDHRPLVSKVCSGVVEMTTRTFTKVSSFVEEFKTLFERRQSVTATELADIIGVATQNSQVTLKESTTSKKIMALTRDAKSIAQRFRRARKSGNVILYTSLSEQLDKVMNILRDSIRMDRAEKERRFMNEMNDFAKMLKKERQPLEGERLLRHVKQIAGVNPTEYILDKLLLEDGTRDEEIRKELQRSYVCKADDGLITDAEVKAAAKQMRTRTAAGESKVSMAAIQATIANCPVAFTSAFNSIIYGREEVPSTWAASNITLILKDGRKDITNLSNWRPISVGHAVMRILERILCTRLHKQIEGRLKNLPLHGFLEGRSTLTATRHFIDQARNWMRLRQQAWRAIVSVDVKGAFDNIRQVYIARALQQLQVSKNLIDGILKLLLSRRASLRLGQYRSEKRISVGLPQGGPLSGLLYVVATEPLMKDLERLDRALYAQYADDTIVLVESSSREGLERQLQVVCDTISAWTRRCGLSLSPEKSKVLCLHHSIRSSTIKLPLIDLKPIQGVTQLKWLGFSLDRRLSTKEEFLHCTSKIKVILNRVLQVARRHVGHLSEKSRWNTISIVAGSVLRYSQAYWQIDAVQKKELYQIVATCARTFLPTIPSRTHLVAQIALGNFIHLVTTKEAGKTKKECYQNWWRQEAVETLRETIPLVSEMDKARKIMAIIEPRMRRRYLELLFGRHIDVCQCATQLSSTKHLVLECEMFEELRMNRAQIPDYRRNMTLLVRDPDFVKIVLKTISSVT